MMLLYRPFPRPSAHDAMSLTFYVTALLLLSPIIFILYAARALSQVIRPCYEKNPLRRHLIMLFEINYNNVVACLTCSAQ